MSGSGAGRAEKDQPRLAPRRSAEPTQTLRRELLDHCGTFPDLAAAQAAIDAWVHTYNHDRPSLGVVGLLQDVARSG